MFNSLQSRLLLISAVVLAVAIATIAILASIYTGETFRGFVASDAQARTARIVLALGNHYQTHGIWDNRVQPLLDNMAITTGYYIFLYSPTGQPLYKSDEAGDFPQFPMNNMMPQPQGQAPNQGINPGQRPRNLNPQGNSPFAPRPRPNFEPFVPINTNNTIVGFVHTMPIPNAPAINQAALQESNNINLLIAATVAGAVAVGLSYILARTVTAPLASLTRAAKKLAKGDLSQRVHIAERGEIGELAEAFNMMAASLERNEQLRRNMVSDVAHELRTPLTNIRGYLEAMQDGLLEPKPELLASLYEETMLVNRLINDLQQLALAEAGQLHIEIAPVDIRHTIEQAVQALNADARKKAIRLEISLAQDLPLVKADSERVGQVLRNLISNAIKYTPPQGTIQVSSYATNHAVYIAVQDSGPGIPQEALPYIFERFYRVDSSRNRKTGGHGLGLAIAKQLVQLMGGTIAVESAEGRGSIFTFALPILQMETPEKV